MNFTNQLSLNFALCHNNFTLWSWLLYLVLNLAPNFVIVARFVYNIIAFPVRRSRGEMYIGHGRLCNCVCVSVPRRIHTLLHEPGRKLGGMVGAVF